MGIIKTVIITFCLLLILLFNNIIPYNAESNPYGVITIGIGSYPDIFNETIIFRNNSGVFLYDITSHKFITVLSIDDSHYSELAIYDKEVIWIENSGLTNYNLDTGNSKLITQTPEPGGYPDIFKENIVLREKRGPNEDIYLHNLSTGEEIQITSDEHIQTYPSIYEDYIVWADGRNLLFDENLDIFMYDLEMNKETQITTNQSLQSHPCVYNNVIVWTDYRNGDADIYLFNISTGEEIQLTDEPGNQTKPVIYEDKIVWIDDRSGDEDLYLYNLSTNETDRLTWNYAAEYEEVDQISIKYCRIHQNGIVWNQVFWDIYPTGASGNSWICFLDLDIDTDSDGIPNYIDIDDDNDGYSDKWEKEHGFDPLNPDSRPPTFFEKYWMHIGITVVIIVVIITYLFKKNKKRSEQVGDGQRRNAGLGEEEGKKGHNSRI